MASSLSLREITPQSRLRADVWSLWVHRVRADAPYTHRSVPNGSVQLVCQVGSEVEILGPGTRPQVRQLPAGATIIGARFRPGSAATVLPDPARELLDRAVQADVLTGRWGPELGERLADAASPLDAVQVLEEQIARRLAVARRGDPAVAAAVSQLLPGRAHWVGSLAPRVGISDRQLRRRVEAAVGVSPKALQRLLRFQAVLALTQEKPPRRYDAHSLADLAADAGYADQSHLSRDCVRFTGLPPERFLQETARQCSHGHQHAAGYAPLFRTSIDA